jgi:hypothetical protein
MSLLNELNRRYGTYGSFYLMNINQEVIVFGSLDNDDMVTKSSLPIVRKNISMFDKNKLLDIQTSGLESLYENFNQQISASTIGIFTLNQSYLPLLFDTIKHYNITHIRFFTDNNKVFIRLFDYRNFVNDITPLIDDNFSLSQTILNDVETYADFTFTLKASSFSKLPTHYFEIEVLENGVVGFISQDNDDEFYFRDQEVIEPIVSFTNEKHNLQTSLLFLPTIDTTWVNTNQLLD